MTRLIGHTLKLLRIVFIERRVPWRLNQLWLLVRLNMILPTFGGQSGEGILALEGVCHGTQGT